MRIVNNTYIIIKDYILLLFLIPYNRVDKLIINLYFTFRECNKK